MAQRMTRGVFSITGRLPSYEKAAKVWYVELEQYDCFWYDLIVNSPDHSEFDESISSYLSHLKKEVENSLEKRFIYFICSRPKIRFDVRRRPRYELFGESLIVYL